MVRCGAGELFMRQYLRRLSESSGYTYRIHTLACQCSNGYDGRTDPDLGDDPDVGQNFDDALSDAYDASQTGWGFAGAQIILFAITLGSIIYLQRKHREGGDAHVVGQSVVSGAEMGMAVLPSETAN
ncbi:uncharacterized protein LY89DRAFT_760339 [Mollisia scopiformis]|uniref:Uncharacterized protein n=1 Tax=Mollisia scopiformis TaxID=149040 RepID=A0A132BEP3_MOLSC|nr:uncharacterized protein LY89DRAFT_760339 [Mollisia scopiformis]KUJ10479.1 hypothetical protein LY89DRAFT_760339 [Mollisia scopiformis]